MQPKKYIVVLLRTEYNEHVHIYKEIDYRSLPVFSKIRSCQRQ